MSAAPPNNQTSRMEFYAVDNYVKAHRDCSYIIVHDSDKRGQEGTRANKREQESDKREQRGDKRGHEGTRGNKNTQEGTRGAKKRTSGDKRELEGTKRGQDRTRGDKRRRNGTQRDATGCGKVGGVP